jgi:selenocysteine lyase/cysteine desulfurase
MSSAPLSSPTVAWSERRTAFALPPSLIYLDAASKAARLNAVQAAAHAAIDAGATPWRQPHDAWMQQIEQTRALAAASLFGGDVDGLAMVPSAAYGLATAANSLPLRRGQTVLVLDGQFPSNLMVWQQCCARVGAQVLAALPVGEETLTDAVLRMVERLPSLGIVSLPNCYWHDGQLLDLDRISVAVHARGAALVLDLSQSLGVLPLELARWQPDFVISVGYKWLLGPMGLSWLWASPRWREEGEPIEHHWLARDAGDAWQFPIDAPPPYQAGARRFDAGGISDPLRLAMAAAGLAQLQRWQPARIAAALGQVTAALDAALDAAGLGAWITPGHAPHITGLRVPAERLDAVAQAFSSHRIICSRRHGGLRLAPYLTVEPEQMAAVVEIAAAAS